MPAQLSEERVQDMWSRYCAGQSLRQIGREFGVRPQSVHGIFYRRGLRRRDLTTARLITGTRVAPETKSLLVAFTRLRVACEVLGCTLEDIDQTLADLPPEAQNRLRTAAMQDLQKLMRSIRKET